MNPIGKTYLIEGKPVENISQENGIFVVNNVDRIKDGFWKGIVKGYGTLFTKEEKKDLLPIGTEVVVDVSKKAAVKLVIGQHVLYVRDVDEVLGVIEND